ncbi:SET domain-containing protein 4 [Halyomorpha halys]|uniref:SET domain-containing protein 4 n=1 Tax=Halyomorpha halys TaxID=286706 RepID=UPI0034D18A42
MGRVARRRNRRKKEIYPSYNSDLISFIHWLLSKGWKPTIKMKLKHFPDTGRGFMAMEPVFSGEIIVKMPKELVISAKTVENSRLGEIFLNQNLKVPVHLVLSAFLMYEKHLCEQSDWHRYIVLLPENYSSPLFCSDKDLENFPPFLTEKVKTMKRSVYHMFEMLLNLSEFKKCKHCNKDFHQIFSYCDFLWAWFTVNSRVVYLSPQENFVHSIPLSDVNSIALVPYLDMLNHSNHARITAKFSFDKGYELKSLVPFKKYDQVFIHYGSHDNFKLFLEYGFIIPNNINDSVHLLVTDIISAIDTSVTVNNVLSLENCQCFLKNLYCTSEGLSWNCRALLYLLLVKDLSIKAALQNVYSGSISAYDLERIADIEKNILSKKIKDISNIVSKLHSKGNIISIGKDLFQFYVIMLNKALSCR